MYMCVWMGGCIFSFLFFSFCLSASGVDVCGGGCCCLTLHTPHQPTTTTTTAEGAHQHTPTPTTTKTEGGLVALQPHTAAFSKMANPHAVLESELKYYSCVTKGVRAWFRYFRVYVCI